MAGFFASSTALTSGSTYTSPTFNTDRYSEIDGAVFADQAGNIFIEQSGNGTNWDVSTTYAVTASTGKFFSEKVVLPFFRVRYVNGGTGQGTFRIKGKLRSTDLAT